MFSLLHRFIVIFFFIGISIFAYSEPLFLNTVKQAERLFHESQYQDAMSLYSHLISLTEEEELKTQLNLRLAVCYLEIGQPEIVLSLISPLVIHPLNVDSVYLLSRAHRQMKNFEQSLELLKQCYTHSTQNKRLILLEKGMQAIAIQDFSSAQYYFESIDWQLENLFTYLIAQLQLIKIYLMTHQYDKAQQSLSHLDAYLPISNPLQIELTYLHALYSLSLSQEEQAIVYFKKILPKALSTKTLWSIQVLQGLIVSYFRQILSLKLSKQKTQDILIKLEALFVSLSKQDHANTTFLLFDFYLIKYKFLNDQKAYLDAQQLIQSDLFSAKQRELAIIKWIDSSTDYQERLRFYDQLISNSSSHQSFLSQIYFLKGLNCFKEGLTCQKSASRQSEIIPFFEQAIEAFKQSLLIKTDENRHSSIDALKYQALAYTFLPQKIEFSWQIVQQLIDDSNKLIDSTHAPIISCIAAWIALKANKQDWLIQAQELLKQIQKKCSVTADWKIRCWQLESRILLHLKEWNQVDQLFQTMLTQISSPFSRGEIYFWLAYSAAQQNDELLKKQYLQKSYLEDAHSEYAPIAYFYLYSYQDYMQGQRKAIKHLQEMPALFASHPLSITAYYLIGLSHEKDCISSEGKLIRFKNLTAAIEAFQKGESLFDNLFRINKISFDQINYFIELRYRLQLERALANLNIAHTSSGGKKKIYLEYAENVFKQIIQDFTTLHSLAQQYLKKPYHKAWAQAELKLAQIYKEKKAWIEAEDVLNQSLNHYQMAEIIQDDGLRQVWYEKALLAREKLDYQTALDYFIEAEKATQYEQTRLKPQEKIDLWIQQSLCYQSLHQFDQAMLLLSQVINDETISPLRIKAMFLRAEIYELQGRPELAIKQLEATSRKGGEWAQKAKEKLEMTYGYSF